MTAFKQWLETITETSIARKAALGLGGLALVGGAIAGPAASNSPETPAETPAIQAQARAPAPTAKEVDYQYERQPNFYYCGPASTRIALTANGHALSQDEVAAKLGTTTNGTDSAHDVTRVLNDVTGEGSYETVSIPGEKATQQQKDKLRADIVDALRNGDAVVANIIGTATDVDGNEHSYPGGHYLTVVGYRDDGRTVKIADPYETRGDGTYWMSTDVLADWIASRGYSA